MDRERIADAVVHGSPYERLRIERKLLFPWTIPRKLRWCTALLFALAAVGPLFLALPEPVRAGHLGADPLWASPALTALGAFGLLAVFGAGLGLAAVERRVRTTDEVDELEARKLVSLEETFSGFGLATGGLAVFGTLLFAASGLAGPEFLATVAEVGVRPYTGAAIGVPVAAVTVGAAMAGGVLAAVGAALPERSAPRAVGYA